MYNSTEGREGQTRLYLCVESKGQDLLRVQLLILLRCERAISAQSLNPTKYTILFKVDGTRSIYLVSKVQVLHRAERKV